MRRRFKAIACLGLIVVSASATLLASEFTFRHFVGSAPPMRHWTPPPPLSPHASSLLSRVGPRYSGFQAARTPAFKSEEGAPDFAHKLVYLSPSSFHQEGMPAPHQTAKIRLELSRSHRIISEATYSSDGFGRRTTVDPWPGRRRAQFAAFLGCSFTFGAYLNDDQTLPSQLAARLPDYHVYNFGVPGSSPAGTLAYLQKGTRVLWNQGVEESDGYAFFTFIDDHIPRILGTMRYLTRDAGAGNSPEFVLRDGELENRGSFRADPFRFQLLTGLAGSDLLRFFDVDLPLPGESTFRLVGRLFSEMRAQVRGMFHAKELYVIIYPGQHLYAERLIRALDAENIPVLDYSSIDPSAVLGGNAKTPDSHPTELADRFLADLLVEDLTDRGVLPRGRELLQ